MSFGGFGLTQKLLAFSRHKVVEPKVVSLGDLILDMDGMLRRLIGENIELVTMPAPDLWMVHVDPGEMEQVLTNIAVNARDAMPNSGKVIIETCDVTFDQEHARSHPGSNTGDYVVLAVTDTGIGMAEEVKSHVFEPFFTTKGVGEGAGLGLSICYGIVSKSGGHITVESEPGKGTTFEVYLPRVDEPANPRCLTSWTNYHLATRRCSWSKTSPSCEVWHLKCCVSRATPSWSRQTVSRP